MLFVEPSWNIFSLHWIYTTQTLHYTSSVPGRKNLNPIWNDKLSHFTQNTITNILLRNYSKRVSRVVKVYYEAVFLNISSGKNLFYVCRFDWRKIIAYPFNFVVDFGIGLVKDASIKLCQINYNKKFYKTSIHRICFTVYKKVIGKC